MPCWVIIGLNKRFEIQFPHISKINWCFGLMINSYYQEKVTIKQLFYHNCDVAMCE